MIHPFASWPEGSGFNPSVRNLHVPLYGVRIGLVIQRIKNKNASRLTSDVCDFICAVLNPLRLKRCGRGSFAAQRLFLRSRCTYILAGEAAYTRHGVLWTLTALREPGVAMLEFHVGRILLARRDTVAAPAR